MAPTLSEMMACVSVAFAIVTFFIGRMSASRSNGAEQQFVTDKLDSIAETCNETRDSVKELNKKLDDHGERLTKAEQQILTIFRRLERLESNCDSRYKPGANE